MGHWIVGFLVVNPWPLMLWFSASTANASLSLMHVSIRVNNNVVCQYSGLKLPSCSKTFVWLLVNGDLTWLRVFYHKDSPALCWQHWVIFFVYQFLHLTCQPFVKWCYLLQPVDVDHIKSGGGSVLYPYNPGSEFLLYILPRVVAESLMHDGQVLIQLSTQSYHCGWRPSPRSFSRSFLFFFGWVRRLNTFIAVPQQSAYCMCKEELVGATSCKLNK